MCLVDTEMSQLRNQVNNESHCVQKGELGVMYLDSSACNMKTWGREWDNRW